MSIHNVLTGVPVKDVKAARRRSATDPQPS
jgi:hypothetical protein